MTSKQEFIIDDAANGPIKVCITHLPNRWHELSVNLPPNINISIRSQRDFYKTIYTGGKINLDEGTQYLMSGKANDGSHAVSLGNIESPELASALILGGETAQKIYSMTREYAYYD